MSVPIRILEGPAQGDYRSIAVLYRSLSPPLPYRRFHDRLQRLAGPGSAALTTSDLAALCCPPRGKPDHRPAHLEINVLDGPAAGLYPSVGALSRRLANDGPIATDTVRHRFERLRRKKGLAAATSVEVSGAELTALIAGDRPEPGGYLAVPLRVLDGPHAGNYRSARALFEQAGSAEMSISYNYFLDRLKLFDSRTARPYQRPREITGAQLVELIARRRINARELRAAATDLRAGNPSATGVHLQHEILRRYGLSIGAKRARRALRKLAAGDEVGGARPPPRPFSRGPWALATRVTDGPYAGSYRSLDELRAALAVDREICPSDFMRRMKAYRLARYGTDNHPADIRHADLLNLLHSTTEARGRRPVPLRITSGPHAGDYPSINALYRALEPAPLMSIACFLNRFQNLCSADATPARVPIELSGDALASLIRPKFLTDERLLSACSAALIRDPGVTVSALAHELQSVLASPISTDRIDQALDEARRLPNRPPPAPANRPTAASTRRTARP